jgi:hypothetical protein
VTRFQAICEAMARCEPVRDLLADILVIDGHAHLGPHRGYYVPGDDIDGIIAVMDSMAVRRVAINALHALEGDWRLGNDLIAEARRRYPGRIIAQAAINPNYRDDVLPEVERCFGGLGCQMLKFHCAWHQVPVDDRAYRPAIEYAAARHVPILVHLTSYDTVGIQHFAALARQYGGAPFILAHSTTPGAIDDIREHCGPIDNIYCDTSGYPMHARAVERLVAGMGASRVVFGSDIAWLNLPYELGGILFAPIPDDAKERILGRNLAALLADSAIPDRG